MCKGRFWIGTCLRTKVYLFTRYSDRIVNCHAIQMSPSHYLTNRATAIYCHQVASAKINKNLETSNFFILFSETKKLCLTSCVLVFQTLRDSEKAPAPMSFLSPELPVLSAMLGKSNNKQRAKPFKSKSCSKSSVRFPLASVKKQFEFLRDLVKFSWNGSSSIIICDDVTIMLYN